MARFLAAVAVAAMAVGAATAGGPPPVYVVADEVVREADRVTIRGSFVRLAADGRAYGKPVEGVVCLGLDAGKAADCRAEWEEWAKAAGTGKVVAVGWCGDGGALLKVKVHKPWAKVTAPDAAYTPGHISDIAKQMFADEPPVRALQAFVKENEEARAARTARR